MDSPNDVLGDVPTSDAGTKALVAAAEAKATREAVVNFMADLLGGNAFTSALISKIGMARKVLLTGG